MSGLFCLKCSICFAEMTFVNLPALIIISFFDNNQWHWLKCFNEVHYNNMTIWSTICWIHKCFFVFIIECVYFDRLFTHAIYKCIQLWSKQWMEIVLWSHQDWLNQFKTCHQVILVWFIKSDKAAKLLGYCLLMSL